MTKDQFLTFSEGVAAAAGKAAGKSGADFDHHLLDLVLQNEATRSAFLAVLRAGTRNEPTELFNVTRTSAELGAALDAFDHDHMVHASGFGTLKSIWES